MKRSLLIFFFACSAIGLTAQITITNATFPVVGDTLKTVTDLSTGNIMITAAGPSQSWDYKSLDGRTRSDYVFKDAKDGNASAFFPNATLVLEVFPIGERYFRVNADEIVEVGINGTDPITGGIPIIGRYTTPLVYQRAPLNYLDQNQTNGEFDVRMAYDDIPDTILSMLPFPIAPDSLRIRLFFDRQDDVDAYGSMHIDAGSFDVLREKRFEVRDPRIEAKTGNLGWLDVTDAIRAALPDSFNINKDTVISYNFVSNDSKEPIAVVFMLDENTIDRIEYKRGMMTSSDRLSGFEHPNMFVYPQSKFWKNTV